MVSAVPLGAERMLIPPRRLVSRSIALDLGEEAAIQLEADRWVDLYIVDEGNWRKLRAGELFSGVVHRLTRSQARTFRAPSAGSWYVVVGNPDDVTVQATLLVSL
jgi:hypothetical protein